MTEIRKTYVATRSLIAFYDRHNGTMSYLHVVDDLLRAAGRGSPRQAEEGLLGSAASLEFRALAPHETDWFQRMTWELLIVRDVANLVLYMQEVIAELVCAAPSRFSTEPMARLVRALPDANYWCLERFLRRNLSLGSFMPEDVRRSLREVLSVRNLIAHRHGVVDERFLKTFQRTDLRAGQQLHIHLRDVDPLLNAIHAAAIFIDDAMVQQFGLELVGVAPTRPS